jgi:hypothetical protein
MKRTTLLICAALLLACLCAWWLRERPRFQPTSPDVPEAPAGEPRAPVNEGGNEYRQNHGQAANGGEVPPTAAPVQPRLIDSNTARERFLAEWQAPIDFYGKVLDENSNAIAGASIRFSWSETPLEGGHKTSLTESDTDGLFSLHGQRGASLQVWVSKDGYYTPKPGFRAFNYALTGHFLPEAQSPVVFRLRRKGAPEPLLRVAGTGLSTMSDYPLSGDGTPTEVSLRDGRQAPIGHGDLRVEVSVGEPLEGSPRRLRWRCRVTIPGGGLVQVNDEFPFLAPQDGYRQTDEWIVDERNRMQAVEKKYYVRLHDGKFGLVTLRVVGTASPYFGLSSLVNPSGSRNLEPAS